MRARLALAVVLCPAFLNAQTAKAPPLSASLPLCQANQLSLTTDNENGNFDGMSQSGTLLVLRNLSPSACRVQPIPRITLQDTSGKTLPVTASLSGTIGMHPGPVSLPIAVAAGAVLTSTLHWVSGEVYTQSVCVQPAHLTLQLGGGNLTTPVSATICGDKLKGISLQINRFALNPGYKPTPPARPQG